MVIARALPDGPVPPKTSNNDFDNKQTHIILKSKGNPKKILGEAVEGVAGVRARRQDEDERREVIGVGVGPTTIILIV
eukprot:6602622-Heterocapsa_arctica.AAC.1